MKLSALVGAPCVDDPDICGVTSDSREVKPGYLFVAIAGHREDGAGYIDDAISRGASAVVASAEHQCAAPVVVVQNPRLCLSEIASRFYPRQPSRVVGVTGTNGKTSTVTFCAHLWRQLGFSAGTVGTLGICSGPVTRKLAHTTPEPVTLHAALDELAGAGVDRVAMEVSSHALVQRRADAVRFTAAAFTNITQDHFDYHAGFDDYRAAKARLFADLLPANGFAVVNADGEGADEMRAVCEASGFRALTTGARGSDITLTRASPHSAGLSISVKHGDCERDIDLPLIGAFQAENALLAAAIVAESGAGYEEVLGQLHCLEGVPGRMQRVAEAADGAAAYIDYAHTPNAIATALAAIRPHARNRLICVIGAGGDRDALKRPHMGRAASLGSDFVIVTDDNPRSEDPASIRSQVLAGAPKALEIGDRAEAIAKAAALLGPGDILLIAGKGHETGQIFKDKVLPFDDAAIARNAMAKRSGVSG